MRKRELLTALLAVAASAFGQTDPPSRVARLNFQQGSVSFRPAGVDDWAAATTNYPLNTGDYLWADQGARAEIHVGSTAIRMDQSTAISVLSLNDQVVQLSLTAGSLNVHIRYLGTGENFEVDTPNVAITLLRPGDYRINADGDNNVSNLVVRAGSAEVTAGTSGAFNVPPGQSGQFAGVDTVSHDIGGAPPPDAFDGWTRDRDLREDRATMSARYVPREMAGYEDLDGYGRWVNMPPYGMVWQPTTVGAGWAPYHNGHWAWVNPYGWTWIDDAPWGFAPFHYGRWAFVAGGWAWMPGAVAVRPVYSPALVAFVGGGGIGIGVAAWFPLGPGEVYRPAYAVSDVYIRNMNVAYVSDVAVIGRGGPVVYMNQRVVGAVTVVPHEVFVGARPVAVAAVVVRPEMVASVRVTGFAPAIAPERVSVMAGGVVAVRTPPAMLVQRTVVVRNAPPPPPVSFAAQQEALRQNGGRPLDMAQVNTLRASQPQRQAMVRPVNQPAPAGFGRTGNNGGPQPAARPAAPLHNDRPPSAQPGARPVVEQPRPTEQARPAAEQGRPTERPAEAHPAPEARREEGKPNGKKPARKNDKTEKKDR